MIMYLYKFPDGKYHDLQQGKTLCGKIIESKEFFLKNIEKRKVGMDHKGKYPDPPEDELCEKCFLFIKT